MGEKLNLTPLKQRAREVEVVIISHLCLLIDLTQWESKCLFLHDRRRFSNLEQAVHLRRFLSFHKDLQDREAILLANYISEGWLPGH